MDRSDIKSITTLSGSNFYQKIIKKYQTGKRKTLRFPMMIFYDNRGYFLSKKISMNILLKLYLNNQNIVPFLNVKNIPSLRGRVSWLNTEKTLPSIGKQNNTQSVNRISIVEFLKSLVFRAENITIEPNKVLRPLFLAAYTVSYQQKAHKISSDSAMMDKQLLNYGNNMRVLDSQKNTSRNSTLIDKENTHKYQSTLEHKSPAILSRDNLLFNSTILNVNRLFFKEINRGTITNPLVRNYYSSEHGASSFVRRRYPDITGSEDLHFRDTLHIEKEIEQIKKIVTETKESALEKPAPSLGEAEIKRYLDINRISDQVYQNIERTIRMERDRRGM